MVALNRDQTTAQPRMALERRAQLLYPRIRPARNHYVSNSHLENLTLFAVLLSGSARPDGVR
jgi:hypothetical protein